jgi:hypothetical protein
MRSIKLDLRQTLYILVNRKFLHRLITSVEQRCPDPTRKGYELRIIEPHCLDVVAAGNRDTVFSTFEL